MVSTLRPRQNGRHFPDDIFKCTFLIEKVWILIEISLKFVPRDQIDNITTLVQIMAWRRPGDKPLSEPMVVSLLTHICVIRHQWVKISKLFSKPKLLIRISIKIDLQAILSLHDEVMDIKQANKAQLVNMVSLLYGNVSTLLLHKNSFHTITSSGKAYPILEKKGNKRSLCTTLFLWVVFSNAGMKPISSMDPVVSRWIWGRYIEFTNVMPDRPLYLDSMFKQ